MREAFAVWVVDNGRTHNAAVCRMHEFPHFRHEPSSLRRGFSLASRDVGTLESVNPLSGAKPACYFRKGLCQNDGTATGDAP